MERYELFLEVMSLVDKRKYLELTFTEDNVAPGDHFLFFKKENSCTCKVGWIGGLLWVTFSNAGPMLLEDCPTSFLESIIKVEKETYGKKDS